MKLVKLALATYVAVAVVGKVKELNGELECNCKDDCWCKRPGFSLFRWAFPVAHTLP